jgi:hypothetical protein
MSQDRVMGDNGVVWVKMCNHPQVGRYVMGPEGPKCKICGTLWVKERPSPPTASGGGDDPGGV